MRKKINAKYIRSFNPCKEGIENFERNYPEFNGTLEELLMLKKVPYDDKIWLAERIVNYKILQQWSVECAELVVDNYNKEYPDDDRIINCIIVTKRYLLGEATSEELSAAESAARSAAWSAAESAAKLAAGSAAGSARSAARSARSAARSAAKLAAKLAARSARSAESEQENINLSILIALL